MSASEKLKALDAAMPNSPLLVDVGYHEYVVALPSGALPQIVAVVEAAEDLLGPAPSPGYIESGLRAALTALEEALS